MNCYLKSIHAAAGAVLLASCASNPGIKTFHSLDTNRDGEVTEHEFATHINSNSFKILDTNSDGGISAAEWSTKETAASSLKLFRAMDADRNGSLSPSEFSAAPGSKKRKEIDGVFRTLDRNHDGGLSWSEISDS